MHKDKISIFNELRSWIIKGHFQEGQYVSSNEICNLLKVSQVPVREVLIQLSERGLLCWEKRRGFKVASCRVGEYVSIINIKRNIFETAVNRLNPLSISYESLIRIDNKVNKIHTENIDWMALNDIFIEYSGTVMSDFEFYVFQISCDKIHSYHRQIYSCQPKKLTQRINVIKKIIDNTIECNKGNIIKLGFEIIDDDLNSVLIS